MTPEQQTSATELNDLLAGRIKAEQMPDLIRYCFENGIYGQFGCYNPHWWVNIGIDYVAWTYADDAEDDNGYEDYERYDSPEELIAENSMFFMAGDDDWWFQPANM
jgi:hypothetical protein